MEYFDWESEVGDFSVRWRSSNRHADGETTVHIADLPTTVTGSDQGWTFVPLPEVIENFLARLAYNTGIRFADETGTWPANEVGARLMDKAEVLSTDQADEELLETTDCLFIPRVSTSIGLARFAGLRRGQALLGAIQFGEEVHPAAPPYGDSATVPDPDSIIPVRQELGLDLRVALVNQVVPPMER